MKDDTPVSALKNIGKTSAGWLREIGVETRRDLVEMGPVMVYKILKHQKPGVSLNLLYGLQAALLDIHWTALPSVIKKTLKAEAEAPLTIGSEDQGC